MNTQPIKKTTESDFLAYQDVQFSGVTNMFDASLVAELANISRETVIDIMKNYAEYTKKWGDRFDK